MPIAKPKLDELLLEPSWRRTWKTVSAYGPTYPWQWQWPENVRRIEHIAPGDHARFYSSSRITLNITRGEMAANGWCPSGRFFEAAACGTPLITDAWEGLDSFFNLQTEIRVVAGAEDVESSLLMPEAELKSMASHARQRTLDEHTGMVRARQLLNYLEEARALTHPYAANAFSKERGRNDDRNHTCRRRGRAHTTARLFQGIAACWLAHGQRRRTSQSRFRISGERS